MANRTIRLDGTIFVTWEEDLTPGATLDVEGVAEPAINGDNRLIKVACGDPRGFYPIYAPNNDFDAAQTAIALVKQFGPPA